MLEIKDVSKSFGGIRAVRDFSLVAKRGDIIGIIGPNGAGKTTLFNVISGVYPPDTGTVFLDGKDLTRMEQYEITLEGISRTFQNIRLFKGLTVLENVMCAFDPRSKYSILGGLFPTFGRLSEEKRGREICEHYLDVVGLYRHKNDLPENLSYGSRRKVEIARALTCKPKALLLDEPAAGLNPTELRDLTELISKLCCDIGFSILLIEHRLELVMDLSHKIHVLNFGKKIAEGTPKEIKEDPEVIMAYLGEEDDKCSK